MLKRFWEILCFLFFLGGSGLVSLIKDYNWDVNAYYKSKLSLFVIAEFPKAAEEDKHGFAEAILRLCVKGPNTFDALAVLPDVRTFSFFLREISRIVFTFLSLYLGYRLFKSSYRIKSSSKDA